MVLFKSVIVLILIINNQGVTAVNKFFPTYENCSKLDQFANSLGDFTRCTLVYTVPFNLCRKCLRQYESLRTVYQSLTGPAISGNADANCPEDIMSRDKLANIQNYFQQSKKIWFTGNCDNCYKVLVDASQKSHLEAFFHLVESLDNCITRSELNVTCTECKSSYTDVNKYYLTLNSEFGNSLCYDIVDMMSLVRDNWSSGFGCAVDHTYDIPTLMLALFVLLLNPLIFYGIGRRFCREKRPTLLQQKRLSAINLANERTKLLVNEQPRMLETIAE